MDHPPLLIEVLLGELVLPDVLQKLQDVNLQYLPIDGSYLKMLLLADKLRVLLALQYEPNRVLELMDGLDRDDLVERDVLGAKVADDYEG